MKNGHAAFVLRQQVCFAKINWENLFYEAIYFLKIYARCKNGGRQYGEFDGGRFGCRPGYKNEVAMAESSAQSLRRPYGGAGHSYGKKAGSEKCVVVTGFKEELVRERLAGENIYFVHQEEQLGTAHAVMQAVPLFKDNRDGYVLVVCGDTPLLRRETIEGLVCACRDHDGAAAVLTAIMDNPFGYGRVLRDAKGHMISIVEQKDGTPDQLAVHEINTGTYVFKTGALLDSLEKVDNKNAQGEYYLTDVFEILIKAGRKVIPVAAEDASETMGVNSRIQLAEADRILRIRKAEDLMAAGVTVTDPYSTYIEQDVEVGQDTVILPGTMLQGKTKVGKNCTLGPDTQLTDVICGDSNHLNRVYAHSCELGDNNEIGPFVHLRPETCLHNDIKIGNFVEVKNSDVDDGTKLPHLIYCGDSDLGKNVNFGCGTVTVNFDGKISTAARLMSMHSSGAIQILWHRFI